MQVRFDDFSYDSEARLLLEGARPVRLPRLSFELLGVLLAERPRALSKRELRERLWPDRVVSDAALSSVVRDLRAALRDPARRSRLVRTVHGFGFAFSGHAVERVGPRGVDPPGRSYHLVHGGRVIPLPPGETIVGRSPDAALPIAAPGLSRHHARFHLGPEGATVEDLGSKNGTFVGGVRVTGPATLRDGDEITMGGVSLTLRVLNPQQSTATQSS